MVATDTVVGVAGAVLLAAVMVGVFVYEYNNTPATGTTPDDADRLERFLDSYSTLGANDDLDGDGVPNYKDDDMDGFGGPDANQTGALQARFPIDGTSAAPPAQTQDDPQAVVVGAGSQSVHAILNYTLAVPTPVPGLPIPRAPTLEMILTAPDGMETRATATQNGADVTLVLTVDNPVAGNYTLNVQQTQAGPATSYAGTLTVAYGPAMPRATTPAA